MNRIFSLVTTLILLFSTSPAGLYAQQQPRQQPADDTVRVTTNLVQVDVVVTDKGGRQVADLRPEDFEIMEDGKRQPITNFSYIAAGEALAAGAGTTSAASGTPVAPARLRREQVRRTIALVVDDLGLSFDSVGFVRRALQTFVEEQMREGDLVAIMLTSSGAGALQQFTSDKRQLYASIERVRWNPQGRGGLSPAAALSEPTPNSDIRDNTRFIEEAEQNRAGLYSAGTFGTVSSIAQGLGEMPGRKALIFLSEVFRLYTAQGRDTQMLMAMKRLVDQANANSVAIYTVDASGLQTDAFEAGDRASGYTYMIDPRALAAVENGPGIHVNPPPRVLPRVDGASAQAERDSGAAFRRLGALMDQRVNQRQESHSVLSYLAASTGGLFMNNRNDLGGALQQVMDDQRGYYLLGYRPDEATIDPAGRRRIRSLDVRVKRAGLKVRARSGYVGLTDEERRPRPRTREEQLTAALTSPFTSGDIGVRLTSLFGVEPNGSPYLRALLHVAARDITFREEAGGARKAELDMVAVAFDESGQPVDQLSYPQTVTLADERAHQKLLESGLSYVLNFPLKKAGAYQMRVAVRDAASEKVGAAVQFVEAPDLSRNRLTLSGLVLSGIEAAATGAAATDVDAQSGPAVRRLRPGMILDYRYQIYNARPDAAGRPQVQTQMRLLRDGQPVFTGKVLPLDTSRQTDMKRLEAIGRLRIGPDLKPGDYLLQVIVTDQLAPDKQRTATQWIDFVIAG